MPKKTCMTAILTYRESCAVGHGINNPKFTTQKFATELPAHEIGAMNLMSQIAAFCWARGIHQYEKIEFVRDEPIR
jgi:hypothetical protein